VIARAQLLALGLGEDAIQHWIKRERLIPLYRGVYALGHAALDGRARWVAAVLACGPGAALSHRSAASLRGLRASSIIEVTTPVARRPRPGIRLHTARLADDEREIVDGIPTTSVARTLLDLATILEPQALEAAFNEAQYRRLTSPTSLAALLDRHPRTKNRATLRRLLARKCLTRTRTEMEADFLAFCDDRGLPRPEMNVARLLRGRWIEADGLYADPGVLIELDGGSHMTTERFHSDRSRDRANLVEGLPTVRVTPRHLREEADELAADLLQLISRPT
jgi:very-short-patch-repair endonuclease